MLGDIMGKLIELTGRRFGRLVVIERGQYEKSGSATWVCICDCGNKKTISGADLRKGHTQSCGCLQIERTKNRNFLNGQEPKDLYHVWVSMRQRIYNHKHKSFNDYGGRGITICEEWDKSYIAFRTWAIANGYEKGLTIDRIDNEKGYCPENCRWVSQKTQANNRRNNTVITYLGESKTISEWADVFHIKSGTLTQRIRKGWPIEKALTMPVKSRQKTPP